MGSRREEGHGGWDGWGVGDERIVSSGAIEEPPDVWCGDCAWRLMLNPTLLRCWWDSWPSSVRDPVESRLAEVREGRRHSYLAEMGPGEILATRVRLAHAMACERANRIEALIVNEGVSGRELAEAERDFILERLRRWDRTLDVLEEIQHYLAQAPDEPVRREAEYMLNQRECRVADEVPGSLSPVPTRAISPKARRMKRARKAYPARKPIPRLVREIFLGTVLIFLVAYAIAALLPGGGS